MGTVALESAVERGSTADVSWDGVVLQLDEEGGEDADACVSGRDGGVAAGSGDLDADVHAAFLAYCGGGDDRTKGVGETVYIEDGEVEEVMRMVKGLTAFIYDHRDAVLPVDLVHVFSEFLSTIHSTSFFIETKGYHNAPSGLELLLEQSLESDHDSDEAGLVVARSTAPDARAVEVTGVRGMNPLVNGVGMNRDHI
jgi:hypothetical protein